MKQQEINVRLTQDIMRTVKDYGQASTSNVKDLELINDLANVIAMRLLVLVEMDNVD